VHLTLVEILQSFLLIGTQNVITTDCEITLNDTDLINLTNVACEETEMSIVVEGWPIFAVEERKVGKKIKNSKNGQRRKQGQCFYDRKSQELLKS